MSVPLTIEQTHIDRVLNALRQRETRYPLECVEGFCPDLTADQVFLAIDYLTQIGQVCLTIDTDRTH